MIYIISEHNEFQKTLLYSQRNALFCQGVIELARSSYEEVMCLITNR